MLTQSGIRVKSSPHIAQIAIKLQQHYVRNGPAPLKQGTKVRVEQTSDRYSYMGVELEQVIPEGQSTPVWTYADKVTLTPQ